MRVRECLLATGVGLIFVVISLVYGCFVSPMDGWFTVKEQFITALILLTGGAFIIIPWLLLLRKQITIKIHRFADWIRRKLRRSPKREKTGLPINLRITGGKTGKTKSKRTLNGKRNSGKPSKVDSRNPAP